MAGHDSTAAYARLWSAVMSQALADVRAAVKRTRKAVMPNPEAVKNADHRESIQWVMSDSKRPGGFLWCCDLFDFDPDFVRAEIVKPRPVAEVTKLVDDFEGDDDGQT